MNPSGAPVAQPLPQPDARPLPPNGPAISAGAPAPPCQSEALLRGGRLYIQHGNETYCLRLTKSGKLLLTK